MSRAGGKLWLKQETAESTTTLVPRASSDITNSSFMIVFNDQMINSLGVQCQPRLLSLADSYLFSCELNAVNTFMAAFVKNFPMKTALF